MNIPLRNIVLNELNNVMIALRTNSRFSSKNRFHYEIVRSRENPLMASVKSLRDEILIKDFETVKKSDIIKPFLKIIESDETTGPITGVALNSLRKLLNYPLFSKEENVARPVENESSLSSPSRKGINNEQISKVCMEEIVHSLKGCQFEVTDSVTDESILVIVLEVFFCCVKSPGGEFLTERLIFDIFKSCFRIGRETRPSENLRRNCEKYLENITEYSFTQLLQGKNYPNHLAKLFRFICSLCDPKEQGKSGSLRLLGLTLANLTIEILGGEISRFPMLLKLSQDRLCLALLRNTTSTNIVIFSQTIRGIENCVMCIPNIHEQIESFLVNCHLHVIGSNSVPIELKEIVLESLVTMCSFKDFPMFLYHHFDCSKTSFNILERIVTFLSRQVKQSDTLHSLHRQSLKVLFQIIHCLHDRCTRSQENYTHQQLLKNPHFQEYRAQKKQKYKILEICELLNKKPKEGLALLLEEFGEKVSPGAFFYKYAKFLRKQSVGKLLHEKKNESYLIDFIRSFDFSGGPMDEALREFAYHCFIRGEGQQVTTILEHFSEWYFELNHEREENYIENKESSFQFAVWMMMLHSDLHNRQNRRKMTFEAFRDSCLTNIFYENKVKKVKEEELSRIYNSIKDDEFTSSDDLTSLHRDRFIWGKCIVKKSEKYAISQTSKSKTEEEEENEGEVREEVEKEINLLEFGNHYIYDFDLFESIWGSVNVTIRIVLEHTQDPYLVQLSMKGFRESAKIASDYELTRTFDHIVVTLCKWTRVLSSHDPTSSPSDHPSSMNLGSDTEAHLVKLGKSKKSMAALRTLFFVTRNYGQSLREGWRNVVHLILVLYELGVIFFEFMDDKTSPWRNYYYEEREKRKKKVLAGRRGEKKDAGSGGWMFGLWGSSYDRDPYAESRAEIEEAENCIKLCRVPELLNEAKGLSNEKSLEYLIKAIVLASQGLFDRFVVEKNSGGRNSRRMNMKIYAFLFLFRLLVEMISSHSVKISKPLWDVIQTHIQTILKKVAHVCKTNGKGVLGKNEYVILDHVVYCLFEMYGRCCAKRRDENEEEVEMEEEEEGEVEGGSRLLNNEELSEIVRASFFEMLGNADAYQSTSFVESYLYPLIALSAEKFVRKHGSTLTEEDQLWAWLVEILGRARKTGMGQSEDHVKSCFSFMLKSGIWIDGSVNFMSKKDDEEEQTEDEDVGREVNRMAKYSNQFLDAVVSIYRSTPLELSEVLYQCYEKQMNTDSSPKSGGYPTYQQEQRGLVILGTLSKFVVGKDRKLRNATMSYLQKILLSDNGVIKRTSATFLSQMFDDILFPLMRLFLTEKSDLRQTRLRFISLLSKSYLHVLPQMFKKEDGGGDEDKNLGEIVWLGMVENCGLCMKTNCEYLTESTPELIKNMLLVMNSQSVLTDELWKKTESELMTHQELENTVREIKRMIGIGEGEDKVEDQPQPSMLFQSPEKEKGGFKIGSPKTPVIPVEKLSIEERSDGDATKSND